MTSKELIKKIIHEWGFPIIEEVEHTIVTRFQMSYVQISVMQEDTTAIAVTLTNVFKADDEREMRLALKTCNELNFRLMQVKLYIDDDNDLVIASEFYYKTEEDVVELLNLALRGVVTAKKRFELQYAENESEDRMIQEINNQE